jgi:hypothetical protein
MLKSHLREPCRLPVAFFLQLRAASSYALLAICFEAAPSILRFPLGQSDHPNMIHLAFGTAILRYTASNESIYSLA